MCLELTEVSESNPCTVNTSSDSDISLPPDMAQNTSISVEHNSDADILGMLPCDTAILHRNVKKKKDCKPNKKSKSAPFYLELSVL